MAGYGGYGAGGMPSSILADLLRNPLYAQGQNAIQTGSSTAPVATPLGGLARALQGVVGGYMVKQARDQAQTRADDYSTTLARALRVGQGKENMVDAQGNFSPASGTPDPETMAAVLAQNPDTASMGLQMQMQETQSQRQLAQALKLQQAKDRLKPPTTREIKENGQIKTQEFDPQTRTWKDVAATPQWNPREAQRNVQTVTTREGVFVLRPDGSLGQRLGSRPSDTGEGGGPFAGTGMQAQLLNVLLAGNPASPEYAAAYSQLATPRFDFTTGTMIKPDMSAFRPPGAGAAAAPPVPPASPETGAGAPIAPEAAPMAAPPPAAPQAAPGPQVMPIPGYAPKMTEGQSAAALYADRLAKSNEILNTMEAVGTQFGQQLKQGVTDATGYNINSPEYQQFDQARRDFVNAVLRRESGAVISQEEFDNARKQYFPMPGDSPEVIKQKRANRETAIEGIRRAAGPAYKPPQPTPGKGPAPGAVEDGYRFKGGNPADPNNWEPAQ